VQSTAQHSLVPDWPAPPGVHACVTTRQLAGRSQPPFDRCNLGNRCGDDPAVVAANRASLVDLLDLPAAPLWLHQVHGINVLDADHFRAGDVEANADAAVARTARTVLAVLTADCLPVFFCSADGDEVAIAHAGWRGLANGVLEATLSVMQTRPSGILCWIGPSIGAMSYEVGPEVRDAFVERDNATAIAFSQTRPGHWLCDLPALARHRLRAAGIERISGGEFDTRSDPRFYSFRRDPHCGRFASLIWRS